MKNETFSPSVGTQKLKKDTYICRICWWQLQQQSNNKSAGKNSTLDFFVYILHEQRDPSSLSKTVPIGVKSPEMSSFSPLFDSPREASPSDYTTIMFQLQRLTAETTKFQQKHQKLLAMNAHMCDATATGTQVQENLHFLAPKPN